MDAPVICIVGVGLLGGSLALAVRQRRLASRVIGTDRMPGLLTRAVERGMIDEAESNLAQAVHSADIVVFCTPVDVIADQVLFAAPFCKPGALLTDVGSTKAAIVAALDKRVPSHVDFIGGHPLAGSEKSGPEYSRIDLFEGKLVLLTPTTATRATVIERASQFWNSLGSRVQIIDAAEHDRALALTSHLPHLLASVLAGVLPNEWRELTASGFRDTSRLAGGSPELWRAIFLHNRAAVLEAIDRYSHHMLSFREAIASADARQLESLLDQARHSRDALPYR